jgi:hypothetical protein
LIVISTEGALLRRSGEIPALALAVAFAVVVALAFLSVIPAGNLLLLLPLPLPSGPKDQHEQVPQGFSLGSHRTAK